MGSMAAEKEARVAAASARKAQLESGLAQISSLQTSQPDAAAEQARLDRDYEVLRRQYEELLGKREQVSLRSDVQTKTAAIDFCIIDPPSRPAVPAARPGQRRAGQEGVSTCRSLGWPNHYK